MADSSVTINVYAKTARANKKLKTVGTTVQRITPKVKGATKATGGLGAGMMKMMGPMVAVTAAIGGMVIAFKAFASATKVFAAYEDTMAQVKAVTEQNSGFTITAFKEMGDEARRLGATTRFSASQAAEGLKYLAMAGFTAQESTKGLEATLRLAQAGNLDMGTAADIASNVMTAFGMEASDLDRVVDVLAKTAATANTDIRQLADGMKYVAPLAAGLGISVEETAAGMAVLSNAGLQGSMAGTGLRMALIGLISEQAKGARVAKTLGLAYSEIDPKTNKLSDVFIKLKQSGFGVEEAFAGMGARGGAAAAVLIKYSDQVEEYTKRLDDAKDAAGAMSETMDNTLKGSFLRAKSAFQEFQLAFMEAGVGQGLRDLIDGFTEWMTVMNESGKAAKWGNEFISSARIFLEGLVSIWDILKKIAYWMPGPMLLRLFSGAGPSVIDREVVVNMNNSSMAATQQAVNDLRAGISKVGSQKDIDNLVESAGKKLSTLEKQLANAPGLFDRKTRSGAFQFDSYVQVKKLEIRLLKKVKGNLEENAKAILDKAKSLAKVKEEATAYFETTMTNLAELEDRITKAHKTIKDVFDKIAEDTTAALPDQQEIVFRLDALGLTDVDEVKAKILKLKDLADGVEVNLKIGEVLGGVGVENRKELGAELDDLQKAEYSDEDLADGEKQEKDRQRVLELSHALEKINDLKKEHAYSPEHEKELARLLKAYPEILKLIAKVKRNKGGAGTQGGVDRELAIIKAKLKGQDDIVEKLEYEEKLRLKILELTDQGITNPEKTAKKLLAGDKAVAEMGKGGDIKVDSLQASGGGGGFSGDILKSAAERTADATEDIAENTQDIDREGSTEVYDHLPSDPNTGIPYDPRLEPGGKERVWTGGDMSHLYPKKTPLVKPWDGKSPTDVKNPVGGDVKVVPTLKQMLRVLDKIGDKEISNWALGVTT